MIIKLNKMALLTACAVTAISSAAYAQTRPAGPASSPQAGAQTDEDVQELGEIVVTGTSVARTAFETALSVSQLPEEQLRTFAGSGSQADILQQVPGLKTEGGGGEVATNLRVRGLPSGGQFEFTPLNYDGVTVFSAFGLNSSAFDLFARNDLGIQRLEFVKGGVSNLFGVSSTSGIINYVSKVGTDEDRGTLQLELAEDNRYRGDFAFQGPLADNTYYAISGFYRYDDGPLDTGQPTEGFSLRGNIERRFSDGSGFVRVHGTYINDRVNFYLPIPVDGTSRERVRGNNGATVYSTNVSDIDGFRFASPEGTTQFDAADGFYTNGGSVYAIMEKDLGDGWGIDGKIKYATYESSSNFFSNGIGTQAPLSQANYLTSVGLTGTAVFTDVRTGRVLAPTDLVYAGAYNNRVRPASDATLEFNLTRKIETGGLTHNLTLGTFISRGEADNDQRSVQFLTQFNNDPGFVNLTINGQQYSLNGITDPLSAYTNQTRSALKQAIYFADQIEADRWSFDVGGRIERATIENRFERTATLPTSFASNPVPGAPITNIAFGTGQFVEGDATATAWALAAGALYRVNDNLNVYANASRGYFFPQAQGTDGQINTVGDITVFDEEPVYQLEAGLKFRNSRFDGYAAAFYTGLRDRNTVTFVGANLTPQVIATSSDTFGVELDGRFSLNDVLTLSGNFTYQNAEFVGDSPASILGKEPDRLPQVLANVGAIFRYNAFDASAFINYQGDTFQDATNTVPLDAYTIARIEAGYTLETRSGDTLRTSVGVWNLFDSEGLAEGNPRAGLIQAAPGANAAFFNGRPILPRRLTFRLTYDF
jgi:outer membrane receptor protein involved in Fe transport